MKSLVRLNRSHVKPASDVLALAFQDYPLLLYAFPDEAERQRMVSYYSQMVLYYGIRYGEVYATSPDFEGVAAWVASDYFPMTFWKIIRSVPMSVIGAFSRGAGKEGSSRMKHAGKYIDAMHKRHAPFKHWFFLIIGVAPQSQGKGCASQLIRPMLDRMDEEGLPCYIETMDERNVRLYEHFGFEVMEEFGIPDAHLTTWALLRDAQGPACGFGHG
ncbi:MAG: GNAT family N-acetyltransferase [Dehalococcoidia bacterium]